MTDESLRLITAAVDGELSAAEARDFARLLDQSQDARELHAQLTADAARVQALPRIAPPTDLFAKVMAKVAIAPLPQPAQPARPDPGPARKRAAAWVPVVAAASVFFCIAALSFAYFTLADTPAGSAKQKPGDPKLVLPVNHDRIPVPPVPTPLPDPKDVVQGPPVSPPPHPAPSPEPPSIAVAPAPRPVSPDLLASPLWPTIPPFDQIRVRIPFLRPVAELPREDAQHELLEELGRDPAYRFDLFVRDPERGVKEFQAAAKTSGVNVFADTTTLDRLKKRQVVSVVIYTESLTAEELTALFVKLSIEDAKVSPRVCDSLHVTPAGRVDELDLRAVLGIDMGLFKRPLGLNGISSGASKDGDPKPLSAGTIDMVLKGVSPPKPIEKTAVLMTWQTAHPAIPRTLPSASAELKQFLSKRGERKPNAVPAIIVFRPVG